MVSPISRERGMLLILFSMPATTRILMMMFVDDDVIVVRNNPRPTLGPAAVPGWDETSIQIPSRCEIPSRDLTFGDIKKLRWN